MSKQIFKKKKVNKTLKSNCDQSRKKKKKKSKFTVSKVNKIFTNYKSTYISHIFRLN